MNIPNGFKIVPVEPTEEMLDVIRGGGYSWHLYSNLLAAVQTPPQPIYDEAKERELFEAYASTHYRLQELPLDFYDGEYIEPEVQYSWESWEARAKSVEVGHE